MRYRLESLLSACFHSALVTSLFQFSWTSEVESRTQGSRPRTRPRTQKKTEAKDSLSEDRHSRGQGQECSRPRPRTKDTSASALQNHKNFLGDLQNQKRKKKKGQHKNFLSDLQKKKKKKGLHKNFSSDLHKNTFSKKFSSASQNFSNSKNIAVLEPRTGQFSRTWGLEATAKDLTFEAKAKDFKMCPRGRPRGQGRPRGLHLCWTYKTFVTLCRCSYTVCIGEFYRTWSDFFSIEVEQIMWSSSWSIWTDKIDLNKADFEQYLFNENAIIRVR